MHGNMAMSPPIDIQVLLPFYKCLHAKECEACTEGIRICCMLRKVLKCHARNVLLHA